MRDWGASLLADDGWPHWLQVFAVLSYCRMRETLETGEIRSKLSGRVWGLRNVDRRWHDLLDRAWDQRERIYGTAHDPADPVMVQRTRAFVRAMIEAGKSG